MAAAARRREPESEWQTAVTCLRQLGVSTERWTATRAELVKLERGVLAAIESLRRFRQTLDREDQRALADRTDEFTGAAYALLGFEGTTPTVNLTPVKSRQLAESRNTLWLAVRRTLSAVTAQVEDLGTEGGNGQNAVPS